VRAHHLASLLAFGRADFRRRRFEEDCVVERAAARLKMRPQPRLVDSLATAYESNAQFERGSSLRLRYAEEFIQRWANVED